mmetsp:Transcript_107541/g.335291  ORF Transcript_107541/g.335291 Transcript_107541/m.335291 type:complete len:381 (+) Transcript_107541:3-1145(+)
MFYRKWANGSTPPPSSGPVMYLLGPTPSLAYFSGAPLALPPVVFLLLGLAATAYGPRESSLAALPGGCVLAKPWGDDGHLGQEGEMEGEMPAVSLLHVATSMVRGRSRSLAAAPLGGTPLAAGNASGPEVALKHTPLLPGPAYSGRLPRSMDVAPPPFTPPAANPTTGSWANLTNSSPVVVRRTPILPPLDISDKSIRSPMPIITTSIAPAANSTNGSQSPRGASPILPPVADNSSSRRLLPLPPLGPVAPPVIEPIDDGRQWKIRDHLVWDHLVHAGRHSRWGSHGTWKVEHPRQMLGPVNFFKTAEFIDWAFFTLALFLFLEVHFAIMNWPSTKKWHATALLLWILLALAYNGVMWVRLGPTKAKEFLVGYMLSSSFR